MIRETTVDQKYYVKLTPANATLVMVDYTTGFLPGLLSMKLDKYMRNVTALARIGQIFKLPTIILGDAGGWRGDFFPQISQYPSTSHRIARHTPSAWHVPEFVEALQQINRPKVIIAGISIDNCVLQNTLDLLRAGYEVYVVVDVSGTDSQLVEMAAMMRLTQAGAVMTSWVSLASELLDDWNTPEGPQVGALYQELSAWGGQDKEPSVSQQSQESQEHIRRIFAALDSLQPDKFVAFFTEDGHMRTGNEAPLVGRNAIHDVLAQGMKATFKGLHHDILGLWTMGNVAIVESSVTYTRINDTSVTLPATTILYMTDDGLVRDYRVYMDIAPAFALS